MCEGGVSLLFGGSERMSPRSGIAIYCFCHRFEKQRHLGGRPSFTAAPLRVFPICIRYTYFACDSGHSINDLFVVSRMLPLPNSFPKCLASQMALAQVVACALNTAHTHFFRSGLSELKHPLGRWGQLLEKNPQGTLCPFVR